MNNYSNSKKSVPIILLVMLLLGVYFHTTKLLQVEQVKAQEIPALKEQVQVLSIQAKDTKSVRLSDLQVRNIVAILMPKKQDQSHFMAILACENSSHDPKRVNINKPGLGYDLGVAQINSRFHSDRVKEFFGQDFDEAMQDPIKNLLYATYLYQHSGPGAWTCNQYITEGK